MTAYLKALLSLQNFCVANNYRGLLRFVDAEIRATSLAMLAGRGK
jgi:hypothetical protein